MIYFGKWQWIDDATGPHWGIPVAEYQVIDLRSLPEQSQVGGEGGYVCFTTEGDPGTDYIAITDDATKELDNSVITTLSDSLKVGLSSTTLKDALWELFTVHSDPIGNTFVKPLMPGDKGNLNLTFGGIETTKRVTVNDPEWPKIQAVFQQDYRKTKEDVDIGKALPGLHLKKLTVFMEKMGVTDHTLFIPEGLSNEVTPLAHETTYTDNFNRPDQSGWGTASGGGGATWNGGTTDWAILANQGRIQSTSNVGNQLQADLSSSDMYCQWVFKSGSGYHGSAARYETGASTAYSYFALVSVTDDRLAKWVTGTRTDLTDTANSFNVNSYIRTYANGSSIKGFIDTNENASVTDTAITGNTRAGVYTVGGGNCDIEDWIAEDLGGGFVSPPGNSTQFLSLLGVGT